MILRDYQLAAVEHAAEWTATAKMGDVQLYAAPTGVGKSVIQLAVQERTGYTIVTPRLEIARGYLQKLGIEPTTEAELIRETQARGIYTPIRFRNLLFRGQIPQVKGLIVDEGHHQLATSYRDVWAACGMPPMLLYTATPFRGSSRATAKFLEDFGQPLWIIKMNEAAARGDIAVPTPEILPLVDDDIIALGSNGEFEVTSLESSLLDRLEDIARIAKSRWHSASGWDRPTAFFLPTVATARRLMNILPDTVLIHGASSNLARRVAFEGVRQSRLALCQVAILSEGVDLPLRRGVDLAPAMSPVRWLQGQYGRLTRPLRPGEPPAEYICTNRNLLRHSYLLDGLCPSSKVAEAAAAFGPSERSGVRAFGLENLGRFKPVHLKLTDGNIASMYLLVDSSGGRLREYACLVTHDAIRWAERVHDDSSGQRSWGRWQAADAPGELRGFVSQGAKPPTEKQIAWWEKSASYYGLASDAKLTRKNFAALPLLKDLGLRLA